MGDSIAQNVNFAYLERETSSRIKTSKAYSAIKDSESRFPNKNVTDVAKEALANTHEADAFTHIVLGAPSVDITNMDTSKLIDSDSIEVYKQNVFLSCQNIFTVAENIIRKHPKLEKVIITEHAQRFDIPDVDPTGLKPELARYANTTFSQMWQASPVRGMIMIGKHSLDCTGDQITARYRSERNNRYDGIHMYGRQGAISFTRSVLQILKSLFPQQQHTFSSSSSPPASSNHSYCPQAQFQKKTTSSQQKYNNVFTVPVNNKFNVLGN